MNRISKLFRHAAILLAVGTVLSPQRVFPQNVASLPSAPQAVTPARHVETSVSVGAAGQLTATRISDSSSALITQSLAPSAGLLATFRQSFMPWLGYTVNFGYTRATYHYTTSASASYTGTTAETYIPNNVYETSVSYLAQKHLTNALTVFGEAGAGAIAFAGINKDVRSTPTFNLIERDNNFRPEGIAGFGFDYLLGHGLGLRAEYRSLFLKYPDYASGTIRLTTISSEPTLSVTYTLGRHSKR